MKIPRASAGSSIRATANKGNVFSDFGDIKEITKKVAYVIKVELFPGNLH